MNISAKLGSVTPKNCLRANIHSGSPLGVVFLISNRQQSTAFSLYNGYRLYSSPIFLAKWFSAKLTHFWRIILYKSQSSNLITTFSVNNFDAMTFTSQEKIQHVPIPLATNTTNISKFLSNPLTMNQNTQPEYATYLILGKSRIKYLLPATQTSFDLQIQCAFSSLMTLGRYSYSYRWLIILKTALITEQLLFR